MSLVELGGPRSRFEIDELLKAYKHSHPVLQYIETIIRLVKEDFFEKNGVSVTGFLSENPQWEFSAHRSAQGLFSLRVNTIQHPQGVWSGHILYTR